MELRYYLNARNLCLDIERQKDMKLFGGLLPIADGGTLVEIPEGDFLGFLKERCPNLPIDFGSTDFQRPQKADALLLLAAKELIKSFQTNEAKEKEGETLRIATEFLVSLIYTPKEKSLGFKEYYLLVKKLLRAYNDFDAVQAVSRKGAFQKPFEHWQKTLEKATKGFETILEALSGSPHLAKFRTKLAVFPLYDEASFKRLAEVESSLRQATIRNLVKRIGQRDNPKVSADDVDTSYWEIYGNRLLTGGNPTGLSIQAAAPMIGVGLFGDKPTKSEDSESYIIRNVPVIEIGGNIAGLNGYVEKAAIKPIGQEAIQMNLLIRDRQYGVGGNAAIIDVSKRLEG